MKKLIICALSSLIAFPALALNVGDKAPSLEMNGWLNGAAIDPPGNGKVTVVEFWATWCPPCKASIPHLNELNKKYGDKLDIVGITTEDESTVKPFAKKMDMTYVIGLDSNNTTADTYMEGVAGIPHAVVVGADGVVVWKGHPMAGMDQILEAILSGDGGSKISRVAVLTEELKKCLAAKDLDGALVSVDKLLEEESGIQLFQMKMGLLIQSGRPDAVSAVYDEMYEALKGDAQQLNAVAWIAATSAYPSRNPAMALKAIRGAIAMAPQDGAIFDTEARVYECLGLLDKALESEENAVKFAANDQDRAEFDVMVKYYKAALKAAKKVK